MAYTLTTSISLGSSRTGFILSAQLFDTSGVEVGGLVTLGFVEIGQGGYLWTYSGFPDNFRGGVKFYNTSYPTVVLTITSVNPEEAEYVAKIKQEVEIIKSQISAIPKEITIEVPHIVTRGRSVDITDDSSIPSRQIEIKTGVR